MKKKKKATSSGPEYGHLILALETATSVSSAALFDGDELLGVVSYHARKTHARLLTVMIDRLLSDLAISPDQLAAVGISGGPGSYTGLRVGVSTAKGLAMAQDIPLLSVSSLEAVAWSVQDLAQATGALIVPMIDARRMEVYTAVFDADLREIQPIRAQILEAGAFSDLLANQKVIFCGDGAAKASELLGGQSPNAWVLPERLSTAASLGKPFLRKLEAGQTEDLIHYEPFYLKDFVATVSRKKLL